jgi:hypothetical protein
VHATPNPYDSTAASGHRPVPPRPAWATGASVSAGVWNPGPRSCEAASAAVRLVAAVDRAARDVNGPAA